MTLVLGDEKKAFPKPTRIKLAMTNPKGVLSLKKTNITSPAVSNASPIEATILDSILSESLPASGEKIAVIAYRATRVNPAFSGSNPFTYCK